MSMKLDRDNNNQRSFIMRNQWIVSVIVILLVPFLLFKGCTALMDSNREKFETRQEEKAKKAAEREAKKEEEKKAKEEKQRQDRLDTLDRQASINRAKAMEAEMNARQATTSKELTQDQCDTVKAENEMMKKAINEGNTNSESPNEYKKNQQELEICKKNGMAE